MFIHGRIQTKMNGRPVDLRVSCLPTSYGESVVLRVLDRSVVNLELDALGIDYIAAETQADALMEVAAGTSQACVIDLLMAGATIGEGTSYPDLTYTVSLNEEEYVVGFRTGSDLTEMFNTFYKEACANGTVQALAEKYGVQEAVILQ